MLKKKKKSPPWQVLVRVKFQRQREKQINLMNENKPKADLKIVAYYY